jgi:drug/metabolite transporter (DMT)-like permease
LGSEASPDLSGAGALVEPATLLEPLGLSAPPELLEPSLFGVGVGGTGVGVGEDGGAGVGVGEDGGTGVGVDGGGGVGVGASSILPPMPGWTQVPGKMQSGMGAICTLLFGAGVGAGWRPPSGMFGSRQSPMPLQSGGAICTLLFGGGVGAACASEAVPMLTARTAAATMAMRLVTLIVFFILFSFLLLPPACFQVYDR